MYRINFGFTKLNVLNVSYANLINRPSKEPGREEGATLRGLHTAKVLRSPSTLQTPWGRWEDAHLVRLTSSQERATSIRLANRSNQGTRSEQSREST